VPRRHGPARSSGGVELASFGLIDIKSLSNRKKSVPAVSIVIVYPRSPQLLT